MTKEEEDEKVWSVKETRLELGEDGFIDCRR